MIANRIRQLQKREKILILILFAVLITLVIPIYIVNPFIEKQQNLKKRIALHNSGKGAKFTRGRKWMLIYKEKFKSKKEAISREYYIKRNRSLRNKIKKKYL